MNFAFTPSSLTVRVGTRVTFTNRDGATHTVTADGGLFNSGNLASGQSFSFTFMGRGSFAYHCKIHPMMTGTITVTG
jgi:plastocyanin